jgi:hypothetical protein
MTLSTQRKSHVPEPSIGLGSDLYVIADTYQGQTLVTNPGEDVVSVTLYARGDEGVTGLANIVATPDAARMLRDVLTDALAGLDA